MAKDTHDDADEIAIQKRIKTALLHFRLGKRWNQERMAAFVGTTKAKYQKYESLTEKRNVPIGVFMRFCENTGVTMEEIARGPMRIRA